MKSHEDWDKLDYAALEADAEKDAHVLEAEKLKQVDSIHLQQKQHLTSPRTHNQNHNQTQDQKQKPRPEVQVSKKERSLEQASIEHARGEAKLLQSRATVARFKARRRAKLKAGKRGEAEEIPKESKEAKDAADLEWITQQADLIVDGRNAAIKLFDAANFEACLQRINSTIATVEQVSKRLPTSRPNRHEDTNKHQHNHGHGHGHGHSCSHGHDHKEGSCKEGDEGEGCGVLEKIGKVVTRAHVQTMVLAAQVYINRCETVAAVNVLRDVLVLDRSVEQAWVLRAKAFLMMGAPLLAELHLTQSEVNAESPRVLALLEMSRSRAKFYHQQPLEEVVERTLAEEGVDSSLSTDARARICEKLLEEGKLLRHERFLHSATIKHASVLKVVYSPLESGQRDDCSSSNKMERVEVEALLNYAACSVHRSTRLMQAIAYCSRVIQLKATLLDPPEALLLRAQAFRALGLYSEARCDLRRAKVSCSRLASLPTRAALDSLLMAEKDVESNEEQIVPRMVEQVNSEVKKIRYLYKVVGQVRISARYAPPVAQRLSPINMGWPANCDLKRWHTSSHASASKDAMSFIVLLLGANGFEEAVNELLPVSERCHGIKFMQHYRSTEQSVTQELRVINSIWSTQDNQTDEESAWKKHGYSVKLVKEEDAFPSVWIDEVTEEGKLFFLSIESCQRDSQTVSEVSKVFVNNPKVFDNTLIVITSLEAKPVPMVVWSRKLFPRPSLEVGTTAEYKEDEGWKRCTVLESTSAGCTLGLGPERSIEVCDLSRVRLAPATVERLFTSNADIAPTVKGIVRATSSAGSSDIEAVSIGSAGRDLSQLLFGTRSSRRYLERANCEETTTVSE